MVEADIKRAVTKTDFETDLNIIRSNQKNTLAVVNVVLCGCVILNLIFGKSSYELLLIFDSSLLAESIQLYEARKQKSSLIAVAALSFAIIVISVLYILSLLGI